jgi:phenylacetate-CoA ligase
MRQEIERRTGIDAVDIYGISEVMGPGVGQEFRDSKDGLTIWEDHFLPEIIDPDTGQPAKEGAIGELVFTSLGKRALPVVRYRTRDLTRLLPGTVTSMRRMARITGRSDDMLIVRGVNLFPSQVEEQILREPALSPHYVLELWREGPLDALKIVVEAREALGEDRHAAVAASLAARVKTMCGVTSSVEIAAAGAVERSVGKAKRVIDRRR